MSFDSDSRCQICGADRSELDEWDRCEACDYFPTDCYASRDELEAMRAEARRRIAADFRAKARHWFLMRDAREGTRKAFAAVGIDVPWS